MVDTVPPKRHTIIKSDGGTLERGTGSPNSPPHRRVAADFFLLQCPFARVRGQGAMQDSIVHLERPTHPWQTMTGELE